MPACRALIVDEDKARRQALKSFLDFLDVGEVVVGGSDALAQGAPFHAVFLGRVRGGAQKLLRQMKGVPLILLEGEMPGAFARLSYPFRFQEFDRILHHLRAYWESQERVGSRPVELFRCLQGTSQAMLEIQHLIAKVADTEATVLIQGESGTGKEVVARNIHFRSGRSKGPFVPINCGAIPGELLESELFGHEKGAFTGAICTRRGRFELAEGGTLFLDEIGDMPPAMQVKLLRVLQERIFERVGGGRPIKADVRIIAATHQNLEEGIRQGSFREDLFYRINVFPIRVPPLRERIEDIPLLIQDIARRLEHEQGRTVRLTPAAVAALKRYPWPGNVRELANLIERLAILHPQGLVDVHQLPERFRPKAEEGQEGPVSPGRLTLPRGGMDLKAYLQVIEYQFIQQALEESGGVVAQAAKLLGMRRTTLVEKMRKLNLQRESIS